MSRRLSLPRSIAAAATLGAAMAVSAATPVAALAPVSSLPAAAPPDPVRGVYVPPTVAASPRALAGLLARLHGTTVNAVVLDLKENGIVPYPSRVPLARAVGAVRPQVTDLAALVRTLRAHGLTPIARIVCFRDPVLATARPEWAIQTADGRPWLDPTYHQRWVDPYNADVWAYNVALAREALGLGFREIQWDYVRFPDVPDSVRAQLVFPAARGRSRATAIRAFVASSRDTLGPLGGAVTADVFGRAITEPDDSGIGQQWDSLATVTDAILPMVYPSHYRAGNFGLPSPNAAPYQLIRRAMAAAITRTGTLPAPRARIRPWLQAFTLGDPPYGAAELRAQIAGAHDAGIDEWVLWNADGNYPATLLAGLTRPAPSPTHRERRTSY